MPIDIPETLSADEYKELPDNFKPIFRQKESDPSQYEYAAHVLQSSMIRAKQERDEVKSERDQYHESLKQFTELGNPEDLRELKSREAMLRDQTKTIEEQISNASREAREREAGRVKALQDEKSSLESNLLQFAQSTVLDGLLANAGVKSGYDQEVRATFASQLKTEMQDGRPVTYVMDPKNPSQLARDPDTGDPLTPMKAFMLYKQEKGDLFRGATEGESGSGFAPGKSNSGTGVDDTDPAQWTWAQKNEFKSRHGTNWQDAYQKRLNAWSDRQKTS